VAAVGPALHISLGFLELLGPLCAAVAIVLGVEFLIVRPGVQGRGRQG
jgi:hypothetical protein